MPSRVLHESFLDSRSIEVLSPAAQDAFPRFLLLADDFGCFEINPRILWARGWSRRPDVSEAHVSAWIGEYETARAPDPDTGGRLAPLLFTWSHAGRRYGYLTGWHGPHGQRRREEYDPDAPAGTPGRHGSRRKTPAPPADLLAAAVSVREIIRKGEKSRDSPQSEITNSSVPARESEVSRAAPADLPPVSAAAVAVAVAVAGAAAAGKKREAAAAAKGSQSSESEPIARITHEEGAGTILEGDPLPSPSDTRTAGPRAAQGPSVKAPIPLAVVPADDGSPPRFPLTDRFRVALAESLARTAPHPIGGGSARGAGTVLAGCERALTALGGEGAIPAAVEACRARVLDANARRERPPMTLRYFVALVDDLVSKRATSPPPRRFVTGLDPATGEPIYSG